MESQKPSYANRTIFKKAIHISGNKANNSKQHSFNPQKENFFLEKQLKLKPLMKINILLLNLHTQRVFAFPKP